MEFDRWDSAFRDVIYEGAYAHQPVFLDVEDSLLVEVARRRGLDLTASQAESALALDVRQTLMLGAASSGFGVFSGHRNRLAHWRESRRWAFADRAAAPPIVALLAVFARAAELMGRDERYTSAAYFPRLHQLLAVEKADENRLVNAYRRDSEQLWGALNAWLESMGGTRGLPTAETIGHRYVGIALSQALMRDADRQLMINLFLSKRLEPGLRLEHDDMAAYLESWIKEGHGSTSIKNLMKNAAGKKALAQMAASALVQWDGARPNEKRERLVAAPLLTARVVRSGLGGVRIHIRFAVRGSAVGSSALPRRWTVLSSQGQPKPEVVLDTLTDRLLAPDDTGDVDAASLVTGRLRLAPAEGDDLAGEVIRMPQPVVVLTYLEDAGLFVEVERARLLECHLLLVNAAATRPNGTPMFDLDALLGEIAQPGFAKVVAVPGLPTGWVLYRDVIIARRHDRHEFALDPLKPAQTSVLSVSGGLRMPGHATRWHAGVPLDVRATAPNAHAVNVRLLLLDDEGDESDEVLAGEWTSDEAELAETTEPGKLGPGRYRAVMAAAGATTRGNTTSVTTFSVCTSDDPRVRVDARPLAYLPYADLAGLTAVPVGGGSASTPTIGGAIVQGAVGLATVAALLPGDAPKPVWWRADASPAQEVVLAEPAAQDSCAVTGRHREQIEQHVKGMRYNPAVCLGCGRVKLYRPTAPSRELHEPQAPVLMHSLAHLGTVQGPRPVPGEAVLDALVWLAGGTPHELAHVIRQVDDSVLTVDETVRALEALAHIDVCRDPATFQVKAWAVSPRALAGLEDGSWLIAGSWDRSSLDALKRATSESDAVMEVDEDGWLPRRRLLGLAEKGLREVAHEVRAAVVPAAGRTLLASLSPLAYGALDLPRVSAGGIFDAEWFKPDVGAWVRVQSIGQPGAYRVRRGFVNKYLYRSEADVRAGTAARASAQTVKHLASGRRPLVGYQAATQTLFVPLGADLPGLYGRALTLLSGRPPASVKGKALLAYQSVAPDVASALVGLLKEVN